MKAERIQVEPFDQLRVQTYKGRMVINEHGIVTISGVVPAEKTEEYHEIANSYKKVTITASDLNGESATLIMGCLTKFSMQMEHKVAYVTLEVKTGTCCMDSETHIRTFQDPSITYRDILDICNASYQNSATIMTEGRGSAVPEFIVQYRETDWDFIRRLASWLHTVIVPDTQTGGTKYFFGLPKWEKRQFPFTDTYKIGRDMEEYAEKRAGGLSLSESDCNYYVAESREIIMLGACVDFSGKELYVYKIESEMKSNELIHRYYLKSAKGLMCGCMYNQRATGISLYGNVTKVKEDKVQVRLLEDENKKESGFKWFPFSTVYSSADGTGWYCMPEPGDTVRLCFPSPDAKDAYVSSAVHEYSDERTDPDIKFLKNRQGKEIRLTPDSILLTNNEGISVELSDRKGIRMKSDGSIMLRADGRIVLNSDNAEIILDAAKRIRLRQGDTEIDISDNIRMEGMNVRLH